MQETPEPRDSKHVSRDSIFSASGQPSQSKSSWLTKETDQSCLKQLSHDVKISVGNAGDHQLILQLLVQSKHAPLQEDFYSRLDDPSYEPSNRLLLKRGNELTGHVMVSKHIAWFEDQRIPVAYLHDFLTLPEFRADGSNISLLQMAEKVAVDEGSALGLVCTDNPDWFFNQGWSCWRGQGYTRANVRSVLSHVDAPHLGKKKKSAPLEVRTWRHFELDSIKKLYEEVSVSEWGPLYRSETNWQWLVGRKAHDQILIAVMKKPDKPKQAPDAPDSNLNEMPDIVGYAVIRDSCIVEMMTLPGYSKVRPLLVAQACRDAIDRDHHFIALHTPPNDSMHELLVTAGGTWVDGTATPNECWMYKLLGPEKWIDKSYPALHQRARENNLDRPNEVDFCVGDVIYRLTLTRRSSRVEIVSSPAEHPIECKWHTFQELLTCNLAIPQAIAQGDLTSSDNRRLECLETLFPAKLFWQSPFPMLQL